MYTYFLFWTVFGNLIKVIYSVMPTDNAQQIANAIKQGLNFHGTVGKIAIFWFFVYREKDKILDKKPFVTKCAPKVPKF